MNKRFKTFESECKFFLILLLLVLSYIYNKDIQSEVRDTFLNCLTCILPPMFPNLILTNLITQNGIPSYIEKKLNKASSFFGFSEDVTMPFIFGLFAGYPSGIKNAYFKYKNGLCSEESLRKISLFIVNPGIVYAVIIIGKNKLNSYKIGFMLYFAVTLSQLIITKIMNKYECKRIYTEREKSSFGLSLVNSVAYTGNTLFNITIWITAFGFISYFVKKIPLQILKNFLLVITDVTNCTGNLLYIESLSVYAFSLGFGGICILFQVLPDLTETKTNIKKYILLRFFTGLLSAVIMQIFVLIIPHEYILCNSGLNTVLLSENSISGFISVIFFIVIFIYSLANPYKI